ncbi:unnamed protein product [Phytophthora fragariaefolia]|uniref:Unnamed protein product n=1 Tax=Phytophthora fragariaefolia TaxID=1490495 RepID=A0A9W6WYV4_9STRA|nr:unnamed protein product [Phytophthora fragariaefolia]
MHEWHVRYEHLISENDDREELSVSLPIWYLPEDIRTSLFNCLRYHLASAPADYVTVLTEFMEELTDLQGLFDKEYINAIRNSDAAPGELELFAALQIHGCDVEVKTLNKTCTGVNSKL